MFGTSGIRGPFDAVSPATAVAVGAAIATVADRVVVARDGRLTGPAMERGLVAGLLGSGADVERLGLLPTHAVAWAARERDAHGVAVTASHNPPEDNGFKLFLPSGREADAAIERRVVDAIEDAPVVDAAAWGTVDEVASVADRYLDAALAHLRGNGADGDATGRGGVTVGLDCGNGVGSVTTPALLRRLGFHVLPVNAQIDGAFPGRDSKPTPDAIEDFRGFVAERCDLGVAHDGDADRTVVVDGDGRIVPEDGVLAVLASDAVERHPGDTPTVLTTPNASDRIDALVGAAGGRVERVPLGGLPEAMDAADDLAFAAEPWKHVFPRFGPWVDGSVAAARVAQLAAAAGDTGRLFEDVMDVAVEKRTVVCEEADKDATMAAVEERLAARFDGDVDRTDGLRYDLDGGWLLVRPSGTEPLIRIYGEGDADHVDDAVACVRDAVDDAGDG